MFEKEVYVIDNASTDDTLEIIESSFSQVKLIKSNKNLGYAAGHNLGIREVKHSNYVLTLNPDVRLKPGYVQTLIEIMSRYPIIGMASGLLVRSDEQTIDSAGIGIMKNRAPYDVKQETKILNQHELDFEYNFGPCGAAALYNRNFIKDLMIESEFFDEDFFAYKEDVDVSWRGQLLGWSSVFVPNAKAIHERGWKKGNRHKISKFVKIHSYKNRYLLIIKNDDFINIFYHFPWLFLYEFMALIYIIFREPYLIQSWLKFWAIFPSIWKKRKLIMEKRKVSPKEIRKWFK
jgi:GT2 family glycosyltransferase